jgi:uroporphyrinogen decarboxylase
LREKAEKLRAKTDYALVGHMGDTAIFQKATFLRGMEAFLVDSVSEPRLFMRILERILEIQARKMENYLGAVGEYLDVVSIGDDLGTQNGPLISPEAFRRLIKPYLRDYFQVVRKKSKAKLHLHCCGSISLLLDDLIEIGVDVINPVQITARDMEPEGLKERFGDRLSFWGGIDTQRILPCAAPEEVANETRRIVEIMSRGGGYVVNPVHNIQWDVPPENVVAMCEAACGPREG